MIVATAGHVDHGKTSLVRSLTGVDTDSLPEEKKRGLSIDLGFAYLPDPANESRTIGFVDVPGHEKFIRNMIAGVGSISQALLVVAADDGLMPQSLEHLAILTLLGVRRIVPVVTKTDLVTKEQLALVAASVQQCLDDRQLAADELFCVSTAQPESVDRLRDYLWNRFDSIIAEGVTPRYFRMVVDRCFTVSGAGTVVTGTVLSGTVAQEDSVFLTLSKEPVRVRGLRTQGEISGQATSGQRCALNITGGGLRRRTPVRGDYLTTNPDLPSSKLFDATVTVVMSMQNNQHRPDDSFKHWVPAHLHVGASSTTCRVALLQSQTLAAGASGLARIYCDKAMSAVAGDRFVLRDQSAKTTIAGGRIVDPLAPQRGRSSAQRIAVLDAMNHDDPGVVFSNLVEISSGGVDIAQFSARFNCTSRAVSGFVESSGERHQAGVWIISSRHWDDLVEKLIGLLEQWHAGKPQLLGASAEQLTKLLKPSTMTALVTTALDQLVKDSQVVKKGSVYRLSSWAAKLDDEHEQRWKQVESMISTGGRTAPRVVEIADALQLPKDEAIKLLNTFVAHGRLFRVSANRYYTASGLLDLGQVAETLARQDRLTVAAFRDESSVGRNLVVELLEFFDRCQFTRRHGPQRRVLRSADTVFD